MPFTDASMSRTPAIWFGLLPTTPTVLPPSLAKPMVMFGAYPPLILKNPDQRFSDHLYHVVWLIGVVRNNACNCFFVGLQDIQCSLIARFFQGTQFLVRNQCYLMVRSITIFIPSIISASDGYLISTTPLWVGYGIDPPRSSKLTSSPVTVLITSGPVMNI